MKKTFLPLFSLLTLLASCAEEEIVNQELTTADVKIDSVAWVESTGTDKSIAYLTGKVLKSGGLEIERGTVLDTAGGVLISGKYQDPDTIIKYALAQEADLNGGVGKFTLAVPTPKMRTKYLYRFYVKNFKGTVLSELDSLISAPNLPSFKDFVSSKPFRDSVKMQAGLSGNGGELIISKGFVVSKLTGPTIKTGIATYVEPDSSSKNFIGSVKGLEPNTTYRFRAFAQNRGGIKYSKELSFKTLP